MKYCISCKVSDSECTKKRFIFGAKCINEDKHKYEKPDKLYVVLIILIGWIADMTIKATESQKKGLEEGMGCSVSVDMDALLGVILFEALLFYSFILPFSIYILVHGIRIIYDIIQLGWSGLLV